MRNPFGGTLDSWVFGVGLDGFTPVLIGGANVLLYTAQSGGDQVTDLAGDAAGLTTFDHVTSEDGLGTFTIGTIAEFWGPDDSTTTVMYASANGGPRLKMVATNVGDLAVTAANAVADLTNLCTNLATDVAASAIVLAYSGSAYPDRPTSSRPAVWIGPVQPAIGPVGGVGMQAGDIWIDTVP